MVQTVIGQTKLKKLLMKLDPLPQFIIVAGPKGSGKSLFISETCKYKLGCEPIEVDSMSAIRDICENAVDVQKPTAYVISNFDNVNFRTKEAILKLCEETPKFIYIFIETQSVANLKQTLLSRAFIFNLETYSKEDLNKYCLTLENVTEAESDSLISTFKTPGNIKRAHALGTQNFISFCDKVVSFIYEVPFGNALKISNSLKLKADSPGFDLDLFFEAIASRALLAKDNLGIDAVYSIIKACSTVSIVLSQTPTINKQMLFDSWLMKVRGIN